MAGASGVRRVRMPEPQEAPSQDHAWRGGAGLRQSQERGGAEDGKPECQGHRERGGRQNAWARARVPQQTLDEEPGAEESACEVLFRT